jgi:tetratricopeptide (TPR) repeat protein
MSDRQTIQSSAVRLEKRILAGKRGHLPVPAIASHWIVMSILFVGALGLGYELLPGQVQRVAMLERDGQSQQARAMLERSYQAGDRSFRTLYQLQGLYEQFGQIDKAGELLRILIERNPRDANVQRRAITFYKMTQDEPAYIRALQAQIAQRYSEDACRELIGILRRSGQFAEEQAAIQNCRLRGYRRPEDMMRLASLVAVDGDLAQASTLMRMVDDVRRMKTEKDRIELFVTLLELDQPREAYRRAVRWLRGARDQSLALALIETLVNNNKHDLAIELTREVSVQGDSVSLAVADVMLDRGETFAAKTYLRGWIEKARFNSLDMISRFIIACLDAEDPENAMAGALRFGLAKVPQDNLVALAEALAAIGKQAEFDAVRAVIQPDVLAGNPLLSAAVALQRGAPEAGQTLLSSVAVDELDEWRLSLWAKLMSNTGRDEAATVALRRLGVENPAQVVPLAQADRVVVEPQMIRRPKRTVKRYRFRPAGALSKYRAKQNVAPQPTPSPFSLGQPGGGG